MAYRELSYRELKDIFIEHNKNKVKEPLTGYIVFSSDNFEKEYSEESRTYVISSDSKAFHPEMGGYSIFGSSLDGSDIDVRLDMYMACERGGKYGWKIEKCYIK